MTEAAAVARGKDPITRARIVEDLSRLGVRSGAVLLVHTAMSRMGWVCGGAQSVIQALLQTTGACAQSACAESEESRSPSEIGTLVMPAQSAALSDPAGWVAPPVPVAWHETIRTHMPAYDPALTPTRGMGLVAEQFRTWPDVRRSGHPQVSFTALGRHAERIVSSQPLEDPFGACSPLATLHELDARILMIGTGWETCTAVHLAERLARPDGPFYEDGTCMLVEDRRQWVRLRLPETDPDAFPTLCAKIDGTAAVRHGHIGMANARLVCMRALIAGVRRTLEQE